MGYTLNIFARFSDNQRQEARKAWLAGVSIPGQRAQRKGVAIGAEAWPAVVRLHPCASKDTLVSNGPKSETPKKREGGLPVVPTFLPCRL